MSIKLLTTLLVPVLLSFSTVHSQNTTAHKINSLVSGAKALQFEIDRDFDLRSFQGSTFSYKIQTSPRTATRIGLSLSASVGNNDNNSMRDDGSFSNNKSDNYRWSIGIKAHRIFYSQPSRRISFFWGLGPTVGISKTSSDNEQLRSGSGGLPPIRLSTESRDAKIWNAGASVVAGVELFVYKSISLLAEYGTDLQYSWSRSVSTRESITDGVSSGIVESESVNKSFGLRAQSVKFGLSAYFGI